MKKGFIAIFLCAVVMCILLAIAWVQKTTLAAHFLSKELNVPVSLNNLSISRETTALSYLWMGNPPQSKTSTSFAAQTITIQKDPFEILENPLVIEQIELSNIAIGIEYYPDGRTNWNYILSSNEKKTSSSRDFVIQTLILNNLTVTVTTAQGKKTTYPTLERLVFHNVTGDGLPISEIEKAIFKKVIQNIFDQFNLFKQYPFQNTPQNTPMQYIPKLFQ
jgi:hypothetical protein